MARMSDIPVGFWKGAFTTADNRTGDLGRVLMATGHVCYQAFYAWAMHKGMDFNPITYVGAMGGLHAVGAGALRLALPTQPIAP